MAFNPNYTRDRNAAKYAARLRSASKADENYKNRNRNKLPLKCIELRCTGCIHELDCERKDAIIKRKVEINQGSLF